MSKVESPEEKKYIWWCEKSCELDARLKWPDDLWPRWFSCGARVPAITSVTTELLKAAWDEWDKYLDDEYTQSDIPIPFHYEDIHTELNRRNEGAHCAV